MIVLDASAAIELLLASAAGRRVRARLRKASTLHAPHLLDLEVVQALRRFVQAGRLEIGRAELALTTLAALDLTRHPHDVLVPRIWALRGSLTAYDAAYLALAEALGAPLLTCDARAAHASGHGAKVELIGS